jgi:hypothetical protein
MSRVIDVADFVDALEGIAKGASVLDPHSFRRWSRLVGATTLWRCFAREQEAEMLMAEGPVETQVSPRLWVIEGAVQGDFRSILTKLEPARNR